MENFRNYLIMEVERKRRVKSVEVENETGQVGYEVRSTLELKEPSRFSLNNLVATLSGEAALYPFKKGDLVAVNLWTRKRRRKGGLVNHISIRDIKLVKDLDNLYL